MARDIEYDDSNLHRLFAELTPRQRLAALKEGFKKEANRVRKTAVNNLRSSGIKMSDGLDKGIRAVVFKRVAGFRITVGPKVSTMKDGSTKEAGIHTNRQGLKKPVLMWAEDGTDDRRVRPKRLSKGRRGRGKRGAAQKAMPSRGRMKRYGFMAQTLDQVRDTVTANIHEMVIEKVVAKAKKYGCK